MKRFALLCIATLVCACAWNPAVAQSWNVQIVDDAGSTGHNSRVAATSDGIPYILYQNGGYYITLAWWISTGVETGGWDRSILPDFDTSYRVLDLQVDANDDLHAAFTTNSGGSRIKYGVFDHATKTWTLAPEQATVLYGDLSLVVRDSLGTMIPSIALSKATSAYQLYVVIRDPGSGMWHEELVYDDYQTKTPSIAVDSAGKLHISFYEVPGRNLMYATNESGVWISEYVDITGMVGSYNAIVIDTGDIPYIVYYDDTNDDLKYAKMDNS